MIVILICKTIKQEVGIE